MSTSTKLVFDGVLIFIVLKESKDRCFVMEALSIVILTKFPLDQAAGMLRGLTAPIIERLKTTLQIPQPVRTSYIKNNIINP